MATAASKKSTTPKKAGVSKKLVKKAVKKVARKAVPDKKNDEKRKPTIKYTDKSAGQPELIPIFENIKKLLLPYVKAPIELVDGTGGMLCLVSRKPVVIANRPRKELWFAAILVQKGYVGFYYMPVYTAPEMKEVFQPELLKCLKGKSCFHIKKNDPQIMSQIKTSLKIGYQLYKDRGWI